MELSEDLPSDCRRRERELFDRAIEKLEAIEGDTAISSRVIEAASFVQKLWLALIKDLKSPGNGLPDDLKVNLISIGMWVCNAASAIAAGNFTMLPRVIEINSEIRDGLK
jgi:flagellar protein FlaF